MQLSFLKIVGIGFILGALCSPAEFYGQTRLEKDREKASLRQQFTKHFRDLQVHSRQMLDNHKAGTLTTTQLSKVTKAIHKSAKVLQSMMVLGELEEEEPIRTIELTEATSFDQAINDLASTVYAFSHSPHHKNHRVFDMVEAAKVQKALFHIIYLSKTLETEAKHYTNSTGSR